MAGPAFACWRFPVSNEATISTRAAVAADATVRRREPCCRRTPKLPLAFYLADRAAVEPFKNVLSLLRAKRMKQIVAANHSYVMAGFVLPDQVNNRASQLQVVNNSDRIPGAELPHRPLLPPPPHDDHEITPAEDRGEILANLTDVNRNVGRLRSGESSSECRPLLEEPEPEKDKGDEPAHQNHCNAGNQNDLG